MDQTAFRLLGGGASFKQKKPRGGAKDGVSADTARDAQTSTPSLAAELDFFGDMTAAAVDTPSQRAGKRRKGGGRPDATDRTQAAEVAMATEAFESLEEVQRFRKSSRIYLKGTDIPWPARNFGDLAACKVPSPVLSTINTLGYSTPSAIQSQAIPTMLADRDVFGIAPTGSGKTLAFAVPIIVALKAPAAKGFRAVIVSPTRELAGQIKREVDRLATTTKLQIRLLDKSTVSANSFGKRSSMKFDVAISTPLRLVHALNTESLSLARVEWLVLDEADQLFENGFDAQIDVIIAACSKPGRRIALFSATMPQRVEELAKSVLVDPVRIRVGASNAAAADVEQRLLFVSSEHGKMVAMRQLIQEGLKPPVLIFVQSKERAKELFSELVYEGINADVIHADRTKKQRDDVVKQFRMGKVWVLIATDLMARGVDFKGVNMVINFDFPGNATDYIHRIGRTGRAGRSGVAVTFFTDSDAGSVKSIANVMRSSGCTVPDWIFDLKNRRKGKSRVVERESISSDLSATVAEAKRSGRGKRKRKHRTA